MAVGELNEHFHIHFTFKFNASWLLQPMKIYNGWDDLVSKHNKPSTAQVKVKNDKIQTWHEINGKKQKQYLILFFKIFLNKENSSSMRLSQKRLDKGGGQCVYVLKLTFHVHGSPAAPSCLEERVPFWLSGDCCAGLLCHTIDLHNGEYICSRSSQTDLKESSMAHQYFSTQIWCQCKILIFYYDSWFSG